LTGKVIIEEVKSTGTMKDAAYRLRKKAAELYHGIEVTVYIVGWKPKRLTKKWPGPKKKAAPE
jgi:hypothetical protein